MLITVAACVPALAVLIGALLLGRRPDLSEDELEVAERMPQHVPPRVEDRVRPAVTASGEKIWVAEDDLIWHEIVSWPDTPFGDAGGELPRRAVG
jgi:hypothetical protein